MLIEDHERMAQTLCQLLRNENYDIDWYANGVDGMEAIKTQIYDIIILDIMLPGMDGYEIAKSTRSNGIHTPILMLTAKTDLDDKIKGLDCGADDYITKPFMVKELLARLRALGRRISNETNGLLSFGDISLDTGILTLSCSSTNQSIRLSEKEYRLLEYLLVNQGRLLTREQIARKIWGFENDSEYNNVEVYMSFTRKKLSFIGSKTQIKSTRNLGYELRYSDVQKNKS